LSCESLVDSMISLFNNESCNRLSTYPHFGEPFINYRININLDKKLREEILEYLQNDQYFRTCEKLLTNSELKN